MSLSWKLSLRSMVVSLGHLEGAVLTSVVVPAVAIDVFRPRGGPILKSVSILPDADAVFGHRVVEKGEESDEFTAQQKKSIRKGAPP